MPAYSFKERFVPMVKDGTKTNTIRAFRKGKPPAPGQTAHLFYGMRTKYCMRLIDPPPIITSVWCIGIRVNGAVYVVNRTWLDEEERNLFLRGALKDITACMLLSAQCDALAWGDGFRHADAPEKRTGCFQIMLHWWRQTHELPFVGNIISWHPNPSLP